MLKFATVLSIATLAAGSALADDGYAGHNCGAYKSPQASIPSVDLAQGYVLPETTATAETAAAPVLLQATETYETVQVIPASTLALPTQ